LEDPLINVSAVTGLSATVENAGAFPDTTPKMAPIRGRQLFPVRYLQGWLVYLVSVKVARRILSLSDIEGLVKTFLNARKSGEVF